ncbi:hypothetical protein CAAN1_07S03554 [[Candida] anglica]|uniref:Uncharacterized protein n=1 Tax=[Candida] anglica TaxID=148631 RepID=A0ABP0EB88_9ASCO
MDSGKSIPINTIARLFQTVSFQEENTRITGKALQLSAEYIRLFTEEAILRALQEQEAEESLTKVDGIDNINSQKLLESQHEGTEAKVVDSQSDEEMDALEEDTQRGVNAYNSEVDLGNDVLDTRHLAKVAGILVLDF